MTEKCRVCGELAAGRARYLVEVSRLLWCAAGSGGDMQAAARECWSWEQEGRSPSRPLRIGEDSTEAGNSGFCGARSGAGEICRLPRVNVGRGSRRAGRPPDLFGWAKTVPGRESPASAVHNRGGGDMLNFCEGLMLEGAGGPVALQTSPPVRRTKSVDTDPHAALRALLVGLRPPTPQSPERLRSTPFDCVAIAPCCFAFRKAVLSHALAALTALNGARAKPCRYALRR